MRFLMMGYSEEDERVQMIETAGHTIDVSAEADSEAWQNAGRTSYDVIWVQWAEADHSIRPLVQYRAVRPTTRIVLEMPDELEPPNSEVAQWVQLGVYDIVREAADISLVISNPATIADALRWSSAAPLAVPEPAAASPALPTVIEKERIIIRPTSRRTTIIAVWSSIPGAGGTTLALAAARVLSAFGRVLVLDRAWPLGPDGHPLPGQTGLGVLASAEPDGLPLDAMISEWEWDTRTRRAVLDTPDWLDAAKQRQWDYAVIDAGVPGPDGVHAPLWESADLNLLVLPPMASRTIGTWGWVGTALHDRPGYRPVVFGADMSRLYSQVPDTVIAPIGLPWPGEPGHTAALESLLAPVMPSDPDSVKLAAKRAAITRLFRDGVGVLILVGLGIVFGPHAWLWVRHVRW